MKGKRQCNGAFTDDLRQNPSMIPALALPQCVVYLYKVSAELIMWYEAPKCRSKQKLNQDQEN